MHRQITLDRMTPGTRGRVSRVARDLTGRAERLAAFGVTPGATIRALQTFPGIVFECDHGTGDRARGRGIDSRGDPVRAQDRPPTQPGDFG